MNDLISKILEDTSAILSLARASKSPADDPDLIELIELLSELEAQATDIMNERGTDRCTAVADRRARIIGLNLTDAIQIKAIP